MLADLTEGLNAPPAENQRTVAWFIDEYLAFKKVRMKERNMPDHQYRSLESILKQPKGWFGSMFPEQITRIKVRSYITHRRDERKAVLLAKKKTGTLSNATVNRELEIFRAALRHGEKEGTLAKAPHIEMTQKPAPRTRSLEEKDIRKLLMACEAPHLRLFVMLAVHTLSRKGAILELEWAQVDLERRLIDFNPPERVQTTKRRVPVPINSVLLIALASAREIARTDYVIEYDDARVKNIKRSFLTACKTAKLSDVTPHTLRHTGATLLARAGVPLWQIAGLMGDDVATVTKHYAKHSPEYLKEAVNVLEAI